MRWHSDCTVLGGSLSRRKGDFLMGYDERFLGVQLPLPQARPERSGEILRCDALTNGILAEYPNYAVVTDCKHRAPAFSVLQINQDLEKKTTRSNKWQIDSRVGADNQLDDAYYANNPFDKGHMSDRESAGWGESTREAQKAADQTFFYANACLQHENLNQDEWVALEQWVLHLDIVQDGKLVVFTGPVFGDYSRTVTPTRRDPAEVPASFFKVICFVNKTTKELDVRAFLVHQDEAALRDKHGRKAFNYQNYQVTVHEIEQLTGLDFADGVYEKNPLFFNETDGAKALGVTSFPERVDVNSADDIVGHGISRTKVRDDEIQVHIAAALVEPPKGGDEWVAILNLETQPVDLAGWTLTDKQKGKTTLKGVVQPGESKTFRSSTGLLPVKLPADGGLLILLNAAGERVDRVDYTKKDVRRAKDQPIFFATYRS
jgi:endonuclease G